jgi:hypothetical protein
LFIWNEMNIKIGQTKEDIKKLLNRAKVVCAFGSRWILSIIACVLLIYAAFLWFKYVANPDWGESQKQDYIKTRQNEAVFDQKKFDAVTGEIEKRKAEYEKNIENVPNIFGL